MTDKLGRELTLVYILEKFSTEESARTYLESVLWPNGPVCPHCGNTDKNRISRIPENPRAKVRPGLYRCAECCKQFTVTIGTICEDSHIPLRKWVIAFYLICSSKTQISALQLQRQLELGSYRTALFMSHRIRYALQEGSFPAKLQGVVEADETYIGGKARGKGRGYVGNKTPVVALVERDGEVRSQVATMVTGEAIGELLQKHVDARANLNTDESQVYTKAGKEFASHDTVNHSKEEYARVDEASGRKASTNTVEGFFGNSKRSLNGTHHSISAEHVGLYFAELDFKYNFRKVRDGERTYQALRRIGGKRLMLKTPKE